VKKTAALSLIIMMFVSNPALAEQTVRSMTMPNGLDLVMMPDGSTPLLSSLLIVRAGSGNETLATAGATHLLEHMIFRGTDTRSQDEIYDSFDRMGAYYNAQTSKTYTNFILVTPVEHASLSMEIQADMILNSVIDPDTLEIEKGRVINEINQGLERSSTRAENIHVHNVYSPTSYGFSTLGTVQGIRAIPAENVAHFHDTWYAVNNMTLVLKGDLTFAEMEQLAIQTYGDLVPQDLPDRTEAWPSGFDDWRYNQLHVAYGATRSGSLTLTIPGPRFDAGDMPAYNALSLLLDDALDEKLTGGEMPMVTYVYSMMDQDPDFSVIDINAGLMPGSDPQAVVDSMIAAIQSVKPAESSLELIRNAIRDGTRSELFFAEQVQYGAFMLVPKLAVAPWGFWKTFELERKNVQLADLESAYRFWYEDPSWIASAYLITEDESSNSGLTMGPIVDERLSNGVRVVARELQGAPVAGIHVAVSGRSAWENENTRGWVDLLHRLLQEGDDLDDRMGDIGMDMSTVDDARVPMDDYRTVPEYSFVRVQAVSDNWAEALQFVAERFKHSDLDESEVKEAADEQLRIAQRQRGSLRSQTTSTFTSLLYGDHLSSQPIYGDETSLTDVDLTALAEFREDAFAAENIVISVIAPAPASQIIEVAELAFNGLTATASRFPLQDTPMSSPGVDTVTASGRQGFLATGFLIDNLPLEKHAAALLANVMVSDRIYRDLGEKKGWAYSAGSRLKMRDGWGAWTALIALPEEHLEEGQAIVYQHLSAVAQGGFDEDRLEIARNDMRGSMLRRYSSRINLAMALSTDVVMYDDPNQTWLLYEQLGNTTLDEVKQAALELFSNAEGVVTVYGIPEGDVQMPSGMPPGMGMGGH